MLISCLECGRKLFQHFLVLCPICSYYLYCKTCVCLIFPIDRSKSKTCANRRCKNVLKRENFEIKSLNIDDFSSDILLLVLDTIKFSPYINEQGDIISCWQKVNSNLLFGRENPLDHLFDICVLLQNLKPNVFIKY